MKRRDAIKLSLMTTAASLAGCGQEERAKHLAAGTGPSGPSTAVYTEKQKIQVHSLVMFLLALNQDGFTDILSKSQNQITNQDSRLKRVRGDVYTKMQKYFNEFVKAHSGGEQGARKELEAISNLMRMASNGGAATMQSEPYPTGEECPCEFNKDCPPVDALLAAFK